MRVLAVDTTSAFGSLALLEEGELCEEMPLHSPDGFSQVLFERIESLLRRHGWTVGSIGCFAAASGPGSFTGVRVGLAAVKALADAAGVSAAGVSNLRALAAYGSAPQRAVLMDARRGEVYAAVYDADGRVLSPEVVMPLPDWLRSLRAAPAEFVGPDLAPFRAALPPEARLMEQRTIAAAVGRIAQRGGDPASLDANYVRRSDAEKLWRDR